MLAVAVDHGNHNSPRPSRRCRFSRRCRRGPLRRCRRCPLRRCRRCLLRRCRYLRNLIPLHCPLPPFGLSPKNSHHTRRDRIDRFIVCRSSDDNDFHFVPAIGIDPPYCPHRSGERFRRLFPVERKGDLMIEFPPVDRPHPAPRQASCKLRNVSDFLSIRISGGSHNGRRSSSSRVISTGSVIPATPRTMTPRTSTKRLFSDTRWFRQAVFVGSPSRSQQASISF